MKFSLWHDWQDFVFEKSKVYSSKNGDRKILNKTFDELHKKERLIQITTFTSFFYSVFVIWKIVNKIRKNQVVVEIRDLNKLFKLNVYSLSLQNDIISKLRKCSHIFVLNVISFFYQWKFHFDDVYKQTIIINKNQEIFLILVISNKNFVLYVQRQRNNILNNFRHFVKTYIDDIVMRPNNLNNHLKHLKIVLKFFVKYNITIKSIKVFIDYLDVFLLKQRINFLKCFISEKKLKTIADIKFSNTL